LKIEDHYLFHRSPFDYVEQSAQRFALPAGGIRNLFFLRHASARRQILKNCLRDNVPSFFTIETHRCFFFAP
jgi:hypothetical protein